MTYEEWLAVEEVSYSDMSTSVMNGFIGEFDLADYVETLTDAKGKMLNATRAANGKFSFDPNDVIGSGVIAYLDSLIALGDEYSESLASFKVAAIDYCKFVNYPNSGKSLLQYNIANDKRTELPFDYPEGGVLKLTVTGCDERCTASTWFDDDDYDTTQNWGKVAQGTTKFVFNLGAKKADTVIVRFPFEGVEAV